jgi:hypothetical protein
VAEGCWKIAGRNGCSDRAELGGGSIGGGVSVGVGVVVVSTSILLAGVMYYLITDLEDDRNLGPSAVGSLEGCEQSKQTAQGSFVWHPPNQPKPKSTRSHNLYTDIKLHNTFTAMLSFFTRILPPPRPRPPPPPVFERPHVISLARTCKCKGLTDSIGYSCSTSYTVDAPLPVTCIFTLQYMKSSCHALSEVPINHATTSIASFFAAAIFFRWQKRLICHY